MTSILPRIFQQMSIRSKLIIYLMATSLVAILVVSIMFSLLIHRQFQSSYFRDLNNLATILGSTTQAALVFDVPEDAATLLSSLRARESVVASYIFDKENKLFASYEIDAIAAMKNQGTKEQYLENMFRAKTDLKLKDGSSIGALVLFDNLQDIQTNKKNAQYLLATASTTAFLATLLLAHFLRNLISKPIGTLTNLVQEFTDEKKINQSCLEQSSPSSISSQQQDEIALLTSSFTSMRNELRESYDQLQQYSLTLEKMVQTRTLELQTALRNLQESQVQLIHSEKMAGLGHLVAGVAHEINNNINFISNVLPTIQNYFSGLPSELANQNDLHAHLPVMLESASEGVRRTKKIISDLTTFARPSKGQLALTNVHKEIDSVINLLHYDLQGTITIKKEFDPTLPHVPCVPDQMNQVYMNILLNAIQACKEKGYIQISTWHNDSQAFISVQDFGQGIPEDVLSAIFDPFFTTKDEGKGTGLGLSLSYGIVQNHGGKIEVKSGKGEGSTFTITLPLHPSGGNHDS